MITKSNVAPPAPNEDRQACEAQRALVQSLRDPACFAHPTGSISIIETHISFVVLTGSFAYKVKKPVDFGFLDFTTLEKRRFFCSEELRLNARFAPQIYLDVVAIGGTREHPRVDVAGPAVEYAVKMRQFAQEALGDRVLARGELTPMHVDALAELVACFHTSASKSGAGDPYGTPAAILSSVAQNFSQIHSMSIRATDLSMVNDTETWTRHQHARLCDVFARRKREGQVRECHGDLHLGNIVLLEGSPRPFDCIEFNPDLRWIDVMNEVAFVVMDLHAADRPDLANRFLNTYLEFCGDYDGLRVLGYYVAYRAMVRAKIGLMRSMQVKSGSEGSAPQQRRYRRFLELARSCTRPRRGFVAITHGFSGSGKTTLSGPLVELSGGIRIRSDVERKRMQGIAPMERTAAAISTGPYSRDHTESTYQRLAELASTVLESGYGVIVDATFLERRHRDMFRALAATKRIPFSIVDFTAGKDVLRERVAVRRQQGQDASDAGLAVLEHQFAAHEPLQADELACVFNYDASRPSGEALLAQSWKALLRQLSSSAN